MFSPHSYIDVHAIPEAIVGDALKKASNDIFVVNCNGILNSHCLCMHSLQLTDLEGKERICKKCKNTRDAIVKEFNFQSILLDDYIDKHDYDLVNLLIDNLKYESYIDFYYEGIPFGKFALYEFWLNHKLSNVRFSPNLWNEYKTQVRNCLISFLAIKKIFATINPERVTTYNSLYSVSRVVCAVAEELNIPTFSLHAGSHINRRLSQMVIVKGFTHEFNRDPYLNITRNKFLSNSEIEIIDEHVFELFRANSPWVYTVKSNNIDSDNLKFKLGIKTSQKVVLAVMRSNDERIAAKFSGVQIFDGNPIFKNQIEWLEWLIDFAHNNPDIFIIFRIHPREFPNKREKVISENAIKFTRFVSSVKHSSNFFINLPENNLSVHDLLKISDLVLNNSSSVGLEAALFGIPVLGIRDNLYSFDPVLQKEANSTSEYSKLIHSLLKRGWSVDDFIVAYRWLNYLFTVVAIDISDAYFVPKSTERSTNKWLKDIKLFRSLSSIAKKSYKKYVLNIFSKNYNYYLNNYQRQNYKLKHHDRLVYAIVNNVKSDIGNFKNYNGKDDLETKSDELQLIESYKKLMSYVSNKNDTVLQDKFEQATKNRL